MESINDIIYNLATYPAILGELILEESLQINQQIHKQIKDNITDNITKLNILSPVFYEYIPTIIISTLITLFLVMLTGFMILYKKSTNTPITPSANTNKKDINKKAVSYTHLTLPTICSV